VRAGLPEMGGASRAALLTVVVAGGLVGFLVIRPYQPWLLVLTVGLTALAIDGIIRSHPRWDGHGLLSTVAFVFLPALTVLGAGLFIHTALEGYARPAAGLAAAALVGVVAYGEYQTVDYGSRLYGPMRLVLAVVTYLAAFALFTVIYDDDMRIPLSAAAVGLVAMALSIELLRESRLVGPSSPLVGLAIGLSLAELRLALYFFPLDGLLAGALLIIGFYLATGLVHHLLDHDLDISTAAEYVLVAGAGVAAVVLTRGAI
jgi:hypothetical protein